MGFVCRSVSPTFNFTFCFQTVFTAPAQVITAPAHPPATGIAVYAAFFFFAATFIVSVLKAVVYHSKAFPLPRSLRIAHKNATSTTCASSTFMLIRHLFTFLSFPHTRSKDPLLQDSCDLLCCGRGYSTLLQQVKEDCECKFIWCCNVECKTCVRTIERRFCN